MSTHPLTTQPARSGAACAPEEPSGGGECQERLAEQLHTLSRVVETITYRLLELEERLADQETQMAELQHQARVPSQFSAGAEKRVDDTEERLARLEMLLNPEAPAPSAVASRHLQPVVGGYRADAAAEQQDCIDGPFLEEPEQPFMDDLQPSGEEPGLDHLSA